MWNARYAEDRIEESRGRPSEVSEKLLAMRKPEMKKLPFTQGKGMMNQVAPGVVHSAIARHYSLWGNFETRALNKNDIKEQERRIPLG